MILAFGEFELDLERFELRRAGDPVAAEPRVLELLAYLARRAPNLVTRDELLAQVWQDSNVSDWALARAVKQARRTLGDSGSAQRWIETVRGRGFRLVAPVSARSGPGGSASDPFFGREATLAAFDEALAAAEAGAGSSLLVAGEPGIGKSRCVREMAARAARRGARVLVGRCPEGGHTSPYAPWTEILRRVAIGSEVGSGRRDGSGDLGAPSSLLRRAILEPAGARVGTQAGGDTGARSRPVPRRATEARLQLAHELAEILRALAASAALVLVFEDLHRADPGTLALLSHLVEDVASQRIVVVGTYRDTEIAAAPLRALGSLSRAERARSLRLEGLGLPEVRAWAEHAWGHAVTEAGARRLRERTAGNPFFLQQALAFGEGAELPRGVREAILQHLATLSPESRALLRLAAVQGREFDLAVLGRAAPPRQDVRALLDEGERARLVARRDGSGVAWRFVHALVAEVLVQEMPGAERRAHHAAIGEALLDLAGPSSSRDGEIAHHLSEAALPGDGARAIAACRKAARGAFERLAYEEAVSLYRRALALLDLNPDLEAPDPELRIALMLRLGEAELLATDVETARRTLVAAASEARRRELPEALAEAALLHAGFEETPYLDEPRVQMLEDALAILPPEDARQRAAVMGRLAQALALDADRERRVALGGEAVRLARRAGDPVTLCQALRGHHLGSWGPDNLQERIALATEAAELARPLGDPILLRDALNDRVADFLEKGDAAALEAEMARFHRLVAKAPQPFFAWFDEHYRAARALWRGNFAEAEEAAERGLAQGRRTGYDLALQCYAVQLYLLRRETGRLDELDAFMSQVAGELPETPWPLAWALARAERQDLAPARAELAAWLGSDGLCLPVNFLWLCRASQLAELAALAGDAHAARILVAALEPYADLHYTVYSFISLGPVGRPLALAEASLGRWEEADAHLEGAIAGCMRLGAPPLEAAARLDRARVALQRAGRGDPERAQREAHRVLEIGKRLGMPHVVAAADGLLRSHPPA